MKKEVKLQVVFYRSSSGHEPVREWLKLLEKTERKAIGEDIKTVQFGWPLGMPLVRKMDQGLWEVRTKSENKIFRLLFTVWEDHIVLLHGFLKKGRKTPKDDLNLAKERMLYMREGS